MIRVLIVDDQELVRAGLRALAVRDGDIEIVGEAADGRSGVASARRLRPDVVLMDLRMPFMDGLEAMRMIAADEGLTEVRIIVLTTFDEDENVFAAIRAGAAGFLLKVIDPEALRKAIRAVAAGEAMLSPSVTRRVLASAARARADPSLLDGLTERECEVLRRIGLGESNQEIGGSLYISPATARTYVSRLLGKLQVRDRSQLAILAYESGLVAPGEQR